jgi:hypothetical protein
MLVRKVEVYRRVLMQKAPHTRQLNGSAGRMEVKPVFDEVSIAVLSGQPAATAAADYGLSVSRVVPILNNYCRRANPAAYREIQPGRFLSDLSISVLRENRDRFLPLRPATAELTKSSSVWCLPGVPGITLVGLYDAGIDTIEGLLKIPVEALSSLPKIGSEGLSRTVAALRSHGFVGQIHEARCFHSSRSDEC